MEKKKREVVILDVDGVLNSYSNRRFYMKFIVRSLRELSKVHGRKKLFKELVGIKKYGGAKGFFVFAKKYCGNDEKYRVFCFNLVNGLDYDCISYDPVMKKMMHCLSSIGNICIRSDGLGDIAKAAWMRVVENKSSREIKQELNRMRIGQSGKKVKLCGKKVWFSGIEDNEFRLKKDKNSWKLFSEKYLVDVEKSVLLDDSRTNLDVAKSLGMTTVHISVMDSFLSKSTGVSIFGHSLSDVLGKNLSKTIEDYRISYGKKVDVKTLFGNILAEDAKAEEKSLEILKKGAFYSCRF